MWVRFLDCHHSRGFSCILHVFVFYFEAEDVIRYDLVTGVQTRALPIFYQADIDMFAFARVDLGAGAEFLMVFNSGEQAQTINVTQEGKHYRLLTTWPDVFVPSCEDVT